MGVRDVEHEELWCLGTKTLDTRSRVIPEQRLNCSPFEAEEAEWWNSRPEVATEIMERAVKSVKASRATPLKTVTMRLPVTDIQTAQVPAERKGLPCQSYIKMLLHEALEKERRSV